MIEPAARARPSRLWLMLGNASYWIYLGHPFAQRVLLIGVNRTVGLASMSPTLYVFTALLAGIAGGVFWHFRVTQACLAGLAGGVRSTFLIDRPMLRACRRLVRARPPKAHASPQS